MVSATQPENNDSPSKNELLLNAFVMTTPGHLSPGLWRHSRNQTENYNKLSFWTSLAQKLDTAGFHAMFIADTLGPYDMYKGPANVDPALLDGESPSRRPYCVEHRHVLFGKRGKELWAGDAGRAR